MVLLKTFTATGSSGEDTSPNDRSRRGYKTVRVRVRGLGPSRLSAIKSPEMAGMKPRKQRKL
ncbi:mitochondrial ribosomal protein S11 [Culex quinquefasciatus]|uniref:Mitochondrial ribosomal protein S11 n=1 Tax=Culex quinquefasciatus TaxID=7176 RepID=B0X6I6_CULQU|nr:mitochondrial ribosomal protein S11 [Culex quinquefasciatus]|eukprot:XP_001865258.1 mitochondrial ribosomal protein S11 [Culex quinquefasciatus]